MSQLSIQLDGDALRQATVQAINGVLSPEIREKIITEAIQELLRPSTNSWQKGQSAIERIFQESVTQVAREESLRLIKEDEVIREKIASTMRSVADQVLSTDVEKLAKNMADSFVASLRRD